MATQKKQKPRGWSTKTRGGPSDSSSREKQYGVNAEGRRSIARPRAVGVVTSRGTPGGRNKVK